MEESANIKSHTNGDSSASINSQAQLQPANQTQAPNENGSGNGTQPASLPSDQPPASAAPPADPSISADEIALYDRQIRLWGVEAQEKIRTANILLIGLKGLANEVAKNLVLAGVGSLTIIDDNVVTEDDLGAQFFLRQESVGLNRAQAALPEIQKLNPRVRINVFTLGGLFQDTSIFAAYTLIIATDMSLQDNSMINAACRMANRPFYAAATYGMYGYIFADLIIHEFVISRDKSNVPTKTGKETSTRSIVAATTSKNSDGKVTEMVTKREKYTPLLLANSSPLPEFHLSNRRRKANVTPVLSCLRALWEYQNQTSKPYPSHTKEDLALFTKLATLKHQELQLPSETLKSEVLRSFLQNVGSELSPVCAFLGGQLAQDVINVVGGKEQPIQNTLVFDGEDTKGPVYALHTELELPVGDPIPVDQMPPMPIAANGMEMPLMGMPLDPMAMTTDYAMMPEMGIAGVEMQSMNPAMGMMDGSMQNFQPSTVVPGANIPDVQQSNNNSAEGMPPPS